MITLRDILVCHHDRTLLLLDFLHIAPGEMMGIIGPPGSGKTVLLKALAGLMPMTVGDINAHGQAWEPDMLRSDAWRSKVGMAFQHDALFDSLSVFENVAFVLRRAGVDESSLELRIHEILQSIGLWDAKDKFPHEISGGMRKRVGVARAVVAKPKLGLFDDPTAGLDPETSVQVLDRLSMLARDVGMASVIVSNALDLIFPLCKQILMLYQGAVLYQGNADKIYESTDPVVAQFVRGSLDGPL